MRNLFLSLVLCCLCYAPAYTAPLSETEVKSFMHQLEQVTQQRDYHAVANLMAPQIKIHYLLSSPSSKKDIQLSRDQYLQNALAGGTNYSDYQYHTQISSIKVTGNWAQVYFQGYERATSKDRGTIDCLMNDMAIVEKSQNRLFLTVLNGNGVMSSQRLF